MRCDGLILKARVECKNRLSMTVCFQNRSSWSIFKLKTEVNVGARTNSLLRLVAGEINENSKSSNT